MRIKRIFKKDFPNNKTELFSYTSKYYYDLSIIKKENNNGWLIDITKTSFDKSFTKSTEGNVFESYKEKAEYYILLSDEEREVGWMAIAPQSWNNTARIWDISVVKDSQRKGFGQLLLKFAEERSKEWNSRALILECQSSNYPAIQFYLKNGFKLIGFDLLAYTNEDIEHHEIRLEMGKILD